MEIKIWSDCNESVPTVYIHSFVGKGEDVWKACHAMYCPPFNLVSIFNFDFEGDLSPWKAEGVRKGQVPFSGGAAEHLQELVEHTIPFVESQLPAPSRYLAHAGYSLAGLFCLWSIYQTDRFDKLACISSSFWYPNCVEFFKKEQMKKKPDCIYFSLGNKESHTHHPLLQTVAARTEEVVEWMKELSVPCLFESNPGNHFTEPDKRTAKAILWILTH